MVTIEVPGTSIRWPQSCACCLAAMTHTVGTKQTKSLYLGVATFKKTLTIAVPYCEPCRQHAVWASGHRYAGIALRVFLVLLIAPMLGAMIALAVPKGPWEAAAMLLMSCGLPLALAIGLGVYEIRKVPRVNDAGHASKGLAVEIADFTKDSMTLRIHNDAYGQAVAAANGSALT